MGTTSSVRFSTDPLEVRSLGTLDYLAAWELQRELVADRAADSGRDTLLLLEHPSVYTAGRRTAPEDRPTDGIPVIDVDRGGKITWHGPGQLVGYPIVKLAVPVDVVNYVRRIEEALISVCTDLGIGCGRVEGRSGVWLPASLTGGSWLPERKIAAIGVRMQRGVAMHGFAINCDADLGPSTRSSRAASPTQASPRSRANSGGRSPSPRSPRQSSPRSRPRSTANSRSPSTTSSASPSTRRPRPRRPASQRTGSPDAHRLPSPGRSASSRRA
ncbi:lipoyl(octanoyl) transferase [Rhodococcus sp. MTM3W5.2]|nr:lipoyl(octanoyl) transferase [Rhodococcus sp. MTM3W5.2]